MLLYSLVGRNFQKRLRAFIDDNDVIPAHDMEGRGCVRRRHEGGPNWTWSFEPRYGHTKFAKQDDSESLIEREGREERTKADGEIAHQLGKRDNGEVVRADMDR
jgi:hypothetical protein